MLRRSVGWSTLTNGQVVRGLEHTTFLAVARDGGKAVGMGRVLFDFGYTAYIGDVIILPDYQRTGLGKRIVESLTQQVLDASAPGDEIMFILGAAKGKEAFYQKLGFEIRPNDRLGH